MYFLEHKKDCSIKKLSGSVFHVFKLSKCPGGWVHLQLFPPPLLSVKNVAFGPGDLAQWCCHLPHKHKDPGLIPGTPPQMWPLFPNSGGANITISLSYLEFCSQFF